MDPDDARSGPDRQRPPVEAPPGHGLLAAVLAMLGWLALVGTVVLTVPRFLEPTTYAVVVLAAATPLGLVGGAVAALAFLAAARLRRRGGVAIAAGALALVLTAVHAAWLAPLVLGPPPAGAGDDSITVLSQNLEYGDVGALTDAAQRASADIVVLVDLTPQTAGSLLGSPLAQAYPYRGGLSSRFPSGTVVLSRYPLDAERTLDATGSSRSYRVTSSPIGAFVLAALHPTPPYGDRTGPWRSELDSIGQGLTPRSAGVDPVLAVGDLNATTDHLPFRRLLAVTGLRDAAELTNSGWAPTFPLGGRFTSHGVVVPPVVRIDHALVGPGLTASSLRRLTVAGADHAGLLVRVERAAGG